MTPYGAPGPDAGQTERRFNCINGTVRSWVFIVLGIAAIITTIADPSHTPKTQWGLPAIVLYSLIVALGAAGLYVSWRRSKRLP